MRSETRKRRPDSWSPKAEALALSPGSGSVSSLHQDGEVLKYANQMEMVRTERSGLQRDPEDMTTWVSHFGHSRGSHGVLKSRRSAVWRRLETRRSVLLHSWVDRGQEDQRSAGDRFCPLDWHVWLTSTGKNHFVLCSLLINQVH